MANATIWADQIRAGDEVRDGYPESANAPVAQEDIAAVAARAIAEEGHDGKSYELTGPETLTRRQKVERIGRGIGREFRYVELTHDEAVEQLTAAMGEYAEWYLQGAARLVEHPQAAVPTVTSMLGRPAMTYEEWARRHVDRFR